MKLNFEKNNSVMGVSSPEKHTLIMTENDNNPLTMFPLDLQVILEFDNEHDLHDKNMKTFVFVLTSTTH